MAKNKTVYEIQLDAEISSLKQSLDQAKNALSSLGGGNFAAGMEKKITNILSAIDKLQKKAGQPIDSKATFGSLEKGFNSVIFDAKSLLGELDKIATLTTKEKISLLPEDEAKKLRDAISAAQDYNKALEKLEKRRIKDLESAKLAKTDTQEKLTSAKSDVKTATAAYKKATAKDTDYGKAQAIVSQAEAAKNAKKEISTLEKQLKEYRKELEELKKVENKTPEQEKRLATVRSNISSVSGKIGARTKTINAAPDEKTLTTAQKTIEQQGPVIEQLGKAVSMAEKEVARLEKSLQNLDAKINENSTEITASQSDYKVLYEQAKKLGISLDGISTDVSAENVKQLKDRLLELVNNGVEPVEKAVNDMTPDLQRVGEVAKEAGEKVQASSQSFASMVESNTRLDNLKSTVAQFVGWTGASKALSAALRNAFEATKELDKAMTEIAVVTDFEVGDMWEQLPEYTNRANELGISITETYEASALFYQQGLDTNEMIELSNETLKMARIAGLDAAEATDRMTAALRGFNMELDQASAQKVADVYSELAAITASDVDEISNAMTKTASIAHSAGMEFETTAAFLSQIIETTRESAETAGTAMKTVIARFQELKKSPDEIGEVEGEIVDANQIETALRSVGVSLRDASGQFRELDDVFLELSSKWDGLDKNTQRYIATIAAGSRQQSRFIAMMQDYGRTQELVTAANNSTGASQRQYEKTLDSLETKLAKLKNAWTEFSTGLMNSDFVKFAVDFLTSILNALNRVTKGFNSFSSSFTKIGTLVAIFQTAKGIVTKFFDELIAKVYTNAYKAGENITKGAQDGINAQQVQPDEKQGINLFGYKQTKKGIEDIKKAKDIKSGYSLSRIGTNEEAQAWQNTRDDVVQKKNIILEKDIKAQNEQIKLIQTRNKLEKEGAQNTDAYQKVQQDINAVESQRTKIKDALWEKDQELLILDEERIYTAEEVANIEAQGFKSILDGAQAAGQALTMVGVGMGMIGQMFTDAGMEGIGEFFSGFGNILTIVGGAMMAIPPIISAIQAVMAAPPLGIILIILGAVVLLITAIVHISKQLSLENTMKKAAEATEEAKEAAQEAKEAYDDMLSDKNHYDELQNTLEDLTYGTNEWKQALVEANQQVLELLQTYPQLAQYLTRGEDGQLAMSDEGWDAMIDQQKQAIKNSQALVAARQLDEQKVKTAMAEQDFNSKATIWRYNGDTYQVDHAATKKLTEELTDLYLIQGDSMAENTKKADELAKKYGITTSQIWNAAAALEANKAEIEAIALETENIARANLTAMASDSLLQSGFSNQVIDTFASAQVAEGYDNLVEERADQLYQKGGASEFQSNEEFKKLAEEYGVSDNMIGDDKHDLQELYKAMAGVEEIPDDIENSEDELVKAIAEMDVANSATKKMDDYAVRLAKISKEEQTDIAGIFSAEGTGMSQEFAQKIVAGFEDEDTSTNSALLEQVQRLGYDSIGKWAEALNMTVEDFYDKAEQNARKAIVARTKALEKMNKALGTTEEKIGKTAKLSAGQEEALAEKIVNLSGIAGADAAKTVKDQLNLALDSAGVKADQLANYLSSINWQDAGDWETIKTSLEAMGITWSEEIENFVNSAKSTANAVKLVDFNKLNEDLKSVYDTIKSIKSGEQNRVFDEDIYKQLIASNKDLKSQFIDLGGEYVFIGSSMQTLTQALEANTKALLQQAQQQLSAKIGIAKLTDEEIKASYAGKDLSLDQDYSDWSDQELRAYLSAFRDAALDQQVALGDKGDANALSYLDTEGIGLSFVTDFANYGTEDLLRMMGMIKTNQDNLINMEKESKEKTEESLILTYTQDYTGRQNANKAQAARTEGDQDTANLYSKALLTQAAQSGLVAEAVMSKYAELIKDGVSEEELAEVIELEEIMSKSLDDVVENQEGLDALISLQNRVADAIYETRQKEIDKLNELNDSVQSANGALISKIQEQIDDARQERENEKAKENISNLQSKLAYLSMDTSGANSLQIKSLEKQIKEAEQSYQDTLIDQTLQEMSDANERAAEQRERQISIMQQQLDYDMESGAIMQQAAKITNDSLNDVNKGKMFKDTEAGKLITNAENWNAKSQAEYQKDMNDLNETAITAATTTIGTDITTEGGKVEKEVDELGGQGANNSINAIATILQKRQANEDSRATAVTNAAAVATGGYRNGFEGVKESPTYQDQLTNFINAGGSSGDFEQQVKDKIKSSGGISTGSLDYDPDTKKGATVLKANNLEKVGLDNTIPTTGDMKIQLDGKPYTASFRFASSAGSNQKAAGVMEEMPHLSNPESGWLTAYGGNLYIYSNAAGHWLPITSDPDGLKDAYLKSLNAFETGGLADFTGPAWLDGTKSRPEYVLNAVQTERFFSLVDILEGIDTKDSGKKPSGDNYFDIEINVEKIEDDYDVEQIADKIRKMIYEDATYRNVNIINQLH